MRITNIVLVMLFSIVIAACGGGGGGGTPPVTLTSISVTPANPSIAKGITQQLAATGTFSDGTSKDITPTVTWSSGTTSVATINASGVATGGGVGTSVISAQQGTISGTTTLTVTAATLNSIAVTPSNPTVPKGLTQQFTATGTYSDGTLYNMTSQVTWSSGSASVATVSNTGLANGLAVGTSVITATMGAVTASTTLTVTGASLSSITITPANPSLPSGLSKQLAAIGAYSDGTSQDITTAVTWSSGATTIATVNSVGSASGVAAGTAVITASMGTVSGTTTLTVTNAILQSLAITPANSGVSKGSTKQLTATGAYSDGSTQNLTATVTWNSATTTTVTVISGGITPGLASGIAAGSSVITATSGAISASTTLTVGYSIGGTISGLAAGNAIVLQNNGGDNLTVNANGGFTFAAPLANNAAYNVSILASPAGQPCTLTYGAASVNAVNVTSVNVICGPAIVGNFIAGSSMASVKDSFAATRLANGNLLVAGGYNLISAIGTTELYDEATNTWTTVGSMQAARWSSTTALLNDGRVLAVGGFNGSSFLDAEIFDPNLKTWSRPLPLTNGQQTNMLAPRHGATATVLPNGKVLVTGGATTIHLSSAELYDPVSGVWSAAGNMSVARYAHTATLLPNGKVLVVGGWNGAATNSTAELYNPATGVFESVNNANLLGRYAHTATLLPNGKVLVVGGAASPTTPSVVSSYQLYDPATNSWSAAASNTLLANAAGHSAILLPTGKVLIAGGSGGLGFANNAATSSAVLYDPANGSLLPTTNPMSAPRVYYNAALLPSGKVLLMGGASNTSGPTLSSTDLYW